MNKRAMVFSLMEGTRFKYLKLTYKVITKYSLRSKEKDAKVYRSICAYCEAENRYYYFVLDVEVEVL
jgi:hypothetical protein